METIRGLVARGCQEGFSGVICDEINAAAEHLYAIREAAEHLLAEAECIGTVHGHRELLVRVGMCRNDIKERPDNRQGMFLGDIAC